MGLDLYFYKVKNKKIAYYRKYNFLIPAIEDILGIEVQNNHDYEVSKDDILELKNRCAKVLKDHSLAEEILPTTEGFFFGSTEYDEYYYDDVEDVFNSCSKIMEEIDTCADSECVIFTANW